MDSGARYRSNVSNSLANVNMVAGKGKKSKKNDKKPQKSDQEKGIIKSIYDIIMDDGSAPP
jgi:hypothetical protein